MEENAKRKRSFVSPIIATAFALFAMLFGSGNIVLPLGLGRELGSMATYAMVGFFLTAVLVPMLGIVAMALYDGNYREFAHRIGKVPGEIVIAICLALMGPFCIIPRCMTVSHSALQWIFPQLSLFYFTLVMAVIIFLATVYKSGVVSLMSFVLGPLKSILLSFVIIKGIFVAQTVLPCSYPWWQTLVKGFSEGYGTLDLLAVLILSGLLLDNLRKNPEGGDRSKKEIITLLIKAGLIGSLMLGVMYAGFVYVAASQSGLEQCITAERTKLLSILASIVLGAGGGILASLTIAIACSTTAIALTAVFADYLNTELPQQTSTCCSFLNHGSVRYVFCLLATLCVAIFFANYGFEGIQNFLYPIVSVLYPALIVLAFTNIMYKAWNFDLGKSPFYITLIVAFVTQFARYW